MLCPSQVWAGSEAIVDDRLCFYRWIGDLKPNSGSCAHVMQWELWDLNEWILIACVLGRQVVFFYSRSTIFLFPMEIIFN